MKTKELKIASFVFYGLAVALIAISIAVFLSALGKVDLSTIAQYAEWKANGTYNPGMSEAKFLLAMKLDETIPTMQTAMYVALGGLASRVASKILEVIYDNVERNSR